MTKSIFTTRAIYKYTFLTLTLFYIIFWLTVPTDNNGDPNDYIRIGKNILNREFSLDLNRFVGYPIFIKLTSINFRFINLTFLVQNIIFLLALYNFSKSLSNSPVLQSFSLLPAFFPQIAYLQELLFPDGLILSLLLLYIYFINNKKYFTALCVSLLLVFIKLVFIFLPCLLLVIKLKNKYHLSQKISVLVNLLIIISMFLGVLVLKPFPLYQTIVQKLDGEQNSLDKEAISSLEIICNNTKHVINNIEILQKISKHSADEHWMPFGSAFATEFKCSKQDVKNIQRNLIYIKFNEAPIAQIKKIFTRFYQASMLDAQAPHATYMLDRKNSILTQYFNIHSIYEESQLSYFKHSSIEPIKLPYIYFLKFFSDFYLNSKIIKMFCLTLSFASFFLFCYLKFKSQVPEIAIHLNFTIVYSFAISLFAFVYDRYVFINRRFQVRSATLIN